VFWIFASVVLILLVLSVPFRKYAIRAALVFACVGLLAGLGYGLYEAYVYEFGPKVVIEGVTYRAGSDDAYYAYQRAREHGAINNDSDIAQ
jgi:hypothetical protein